MNRSHTLFATRPDPGNAIPKTSAVRLFLDTTLSVADATSAPAAARVPGQMISPGGQGQLTINLTVP